MHCHFAWRNVKRSTVFLRGRRLLWGFNASWRISSTKGYMQIAYRLLCARTEQLHMCPHSRTKNISKCRLAYHPQCLASGKKSIEQLNPSEPPQWSPRNLNREVVKWSTFYNQLPLATNGSLCPFTRYQIVATGGENNYCQTGMHNFCISVIRTNYSLRLLFVGWEEGGRFPPQTLKLPSQAAAS